MLPVIRLFALLPLPATEQARQGDCSRTGTNQDTSNPTKQAAEIPFRQIWVEKRNHRRAQLAGCSKVTTHASAKQRSADGRKTRFCRVRLQAQVHARNNQGAKKPGKQTRGTEYKRRSVITGSSKQSDSDTNAASSQWPNKILELQCCSSSNTIAPSANTKCMFDLGGATFLVGGLKRIYLDAISHQRFFLLFPKDHKSDGVYASRI